MAQIANPSLFGATPDTDPMAGERARLSQVDPPINNLGDEMVWPAASIVPVAGALRALPYAVRMGETGIAAARGLTIQANQALNAFAHATMNRLGRMPTAGIWSTPRKRC